MRSRRHLLPGFVDPDSGDWSLLSREVGGAVIEHLLGRTPGILPLSVSGFDGMRRALDPGWVLFCLSGLVGKCQVVAHSRALALPAGFVRLDGTVETNKLRDAVHTQGHTLLLQGLERNVPEVALLGRSLEAALMHAGAVLSHPVQANLYLTPPKCQGFDVHYDDHDVVVFQVAGRKNWEIFAEYVPWPLEVPDKQPTREQVGDPVAQVELQEGRMLIVPRGFPHLARSTGDEDSVHLTLAVRFLTWLDIGVAALKGDPRMREAMAALTVGGGQMPSHTMGHLAGEDVARAARQHRLRFVSGLHPFPDWRPMANMDLPREGQRFCLSNGVFLLLDVVDDTVHVAAPGIKFSVPANALEALTFVAAGGVWGPQEVPGAPTEQARDSLVGRLLRHGLIRPFDG